MQTKKLLPLFLIALVATIPIATAQTVISQNGYWTQAQYGHWYISDRNATQTSGTTHYEVGTITNFSGFATIWNITEFGALLPDWWLNTYGELDFAWGFTGADGTTIYTNGQLNRGVSAIIGNHVPTFTWGIQNDLYQYGYLHGLSIGDATPTNPITGTLAIYRNNTSLIFSIPRIYIDWSAYFNTSKGWSLSTPVQGMTSVNRMTWDTERQYFDVLLSEEWFTSVKIDLWIGWRGNPQANISLSTLTFTDGQIPDLETLQPMPEDGSSIINPNPNSGDWWSQLTSIANGLWLAICFVKDLLLFILPYTPYIIIGLGLFALYSCWKAKSVEPIQNFFSFLWGLILATIAVFAKVVEVIRGLFRI